MEIRFKQWDCIVEFSKYLNGRTAIELIDKHDGAPVAVVTINLPNIPLEDDEVIIKDYSENEGMLDTLMKCNIVDRPLKYAKSGFVHVPICKLLKTN